MKYVRCFHVVCAHQALSTVVRTLRGCPQLISPTLPVYGGVVFATEFSYGVPTFNCGVVPYCGGVSVTILVP